MNQAWHIFKKDVRYLRLEIGLVIALAGLFTLAHPAGAWILLALATGYLISRLIHAEAIPGDRQFWITRPYRWQSLLAAKLLFILLFANAPVFLAQSVILTARGFPLLPNLGGLIWSQTLFLLGVSLPVAVLAALTSGIVAFIFSAMLIVGIGWSTFLNFGLDTAWPPALDWIRDGILGTTLALGAMLLLYLQYRTHRTFLLRWVGAVTIAIGFLAAWFVNLSLAIDIQSVFAEDSTDSGSIDLSLDYDRVAPSGPSVVDGRVIVQFPTVITGVPESTQLQVHRLDLRLEGPSGEMPLPDTFGSNGFWNGSGSRGAMLTVPEFELWRDLPLTLGVRIYGTLYGNPQSVTLDLDETWTHIDILDGVQCNVSIEPARDSRLDLLVCRSPFRWPPRLVAAELGEGMASPMRRISLSPFPSGLDAARLGELQDSRLLDDAPPESRNRVTIEVRDPLLHFEKNFQISDLDLDDFVIP